MKLQELWFLRFTLTEEGLLMIDGHGMLSFRVLGSIGLLKRLALIKVLNLLSEAP